MLKSNRTRYFFTDPADAILGLVERFASENDGEVEDGIRSLGIYRFADSTGGKRFLTVAVRSNDDGSDVQGNVTLRWRDEPDGPYEQLSDRLRDILSDRVELLSLPEARRRKNQD